MKKETPQKEAGTGQIQQILFKYIPYWPVFLILFVISAALAVFYLKTTPPTYRAVASLLIKDEKKGEEYSKMEQMFMMFGNKNIVENQVEVISSLPVMTEVARTLDLCTPVFTQSGWKGMTVLLAYETCPIEVKAKRPDRLPSPKENRFFFTWNREKNTVTVNNKTYPINQWVSTPWDTLKFDWNPRFRPEYLPENKNTKFFFSVVNERGIVKMLDGAFTATAKNKLATIVDLRVNDLNPNRAEAILTEIVNSYHRLSMERTNETARNTLAWIEKRLANVSLEIDSLELGIQNFRTGSQVVDIGEQGRITLQGAQQTVQLLNTYEFQLQALEEVEKYIKAKESAGGIAPSIINITDNSLRDLIEKLAQAETRYRQLKPTTGENSPTLLTIQDEITKLRGMILDNVSNQKASVNSGINRLKNINQEYSSKLSTIPKKERDLLEATRSRGTKNEIYAFLLGKKEEVSYSLNSTDYSSYYVDKPSAVNGPVSPNINMVAFLTLMFPVIAGVGGISLREFLNNKILFRADVEKLSSIPIAGEIVFEKIDYKNAPVRSFAVEQFRHLRHSLKFIKTGDTVLKRILITSSEMGEGKSYVSINLAKSFARSGKKVVLMEFDLHKPKIRKLLHINEDLPGITDYLHGEANEKEIVIPVENDSKLFVVPSGTGHEDVSELFHSPNFETLLNYLDTQFDIVIIDSAPVNAVADAYEISQHVQLTLFVVRHNFTKKAVIERLDGELSLRNVHPVALVFNGIKGRGFGKFSYGYGHGYGYDNKSTYNAYNKKKK